MDTTALDDLYSTHSHDLAIHAASTGDLNVFQYAIELNCNLRDAWTVAILNGHLNILQHGYDRNLLPIRDPFLCSDAVFYEQFEILKWLRSVKCDWNNISCEYAAKKGNVEILTWLHANNCPWDSFIFSTAAEYSDINMLTFLFEQKCPWDEYTCANSKNLATLQWLRKHGCPWDSYTCSLAALNGDLEKLQWARANGCPWSSDVCEYATAHGHFHVLKWARANGCPWNPFYLCERAVIGGHLNILKWLLKQGCPWTSEAQFMLFRQKQFHIIHWLLRNGYELDKEEMMACKVIFTHPINHYNSIKWLYETHGFFGNSDVKKWLSVIDQIDNVIHVSDVADVIKNYI